MEGGEGSNNKRRVVAGKFVHNKSYPTLKIEPSTRNSLKRALEKFIASCGISLRTKALSSHVPFCVSSQEKVSTLKIFIILFPLSMLVLLRISRPIKSDRMNLLFYGNVNMLFIKFSSPASSLASMCASM